MTEDANPHPGERFLWRARFLLRRYLLVYGAWHQAFAARSSRGAFDFDQFVLDFANGKLPSADTRELAGQMAQRLEEEYASRAPSEGIPVWDRYLEVIGVLDLSPAEADLLVLLLADSVDGQVHSFFRLLLEDAPRLPWSLLRRILDPLDQRVAEVGQACAHGRPLVATGLVHRDAADDTLALEPRFALWLCSGVDALGPPGPGVVRLHSAASCAALAERAAAALGHEVARVDDALEIGRDVVITSAPGDGAAWLAAHAAHRRGTALAEVDLAAANARGSFGPSLFADLLLRRCAVLVRLGNLGAEEAIERARQLAQLRALPLPALIAQLGVDAHPTAAAEVFGDAGMPCLPLGPGTAARREAWWRAALEHRRAGFAGDTGAWPALLRAFPLGPVAIDAALVAAITSRSDEVFSAVERACVSLTSSELDELAIRVSGAAIRPEHAMPAELRAAVEHLVEGTAIGAPARLGILSIEASGGVGLEQAAGLVARDLDLLLYEAPIGRISAQPPPAACEHLTRIFRVADRTGCALLFRDLLPLLEHSEPLRLALLELLRTHAGLVILSKEDMGLLWPDAASTATGPFAEPT